MYVFLWFFREFYKKQYGVVVYGHSVKYSYEIPNEYLSGSMAISLLAYVAIFSDSFLFGYFFTVFESNFFQSITRATFSEQLFLQSRYLFWGAPFSKQSFLSCIFSSENLPRNQTLKVGNSFVQLPFRKATHRTHLQKSYFFEADSSAQHQLFF